jgi:MinD-like ATPase involved in chromosome partitioning or flagellar assembly
MARAGDSTVAVAAHAGGPITLTSQLDAPAVPGLSDVLAERVAVDDAMHRAARYPLLNVVGAGGCANAAGPSREAIAGVYTALRDKASYVVVDAAPMSVSADAQLLASDADAVLLVVESGLDRVADVSEAVQAMRRIDAPLVGAVVLPPAPRTAVEPLSVPDTEAEVTDEHRERTRAVLPRQADELAPDDTPTESLPIVTDDLTITDAPQPKTANQRPKAGAAKRGRRVEPAK